MSFPLYCDGTDDGRGAHRIGRDWNCAGCGFNVPLDLRKHSTADEINARINEAAPLLRAFARAADDYFERTIRPRIWWRIRLELAKAETHFALTYDPCAHPTVYGDGSGWTCLRCRQRVPITSWIKAWRAPKGNR